MLRKLIIVSIFICYGSAYAEQVITLNVTSQPPLHAPDRSGFLDVLSAEAFDAIGYRVRTTQLPAERGLVSANSGIIDGELARVEGIDKTYTNLIRVPEKLIDTEFVVFSRKPIDLSAGWRGLNDKAVAFINGWKILEKNVPRAAEITKVQNPEQLFTLIKHDRTDYVIYINWSGYHFIQKLDIKGLEIREPPLARKGLYMYLHKKHQHIVEPLSSALAELKQTGRYQALFEKHLVSLQKAYKGDLQK